MSWPKVGARVRVVGGFEDGLVGVVVDRIQLPADAMPTYVLEVGDGGRVGRFSAWRLEEVEL